VEPAVTELLNTHQQLTQDAIEDQRELAGVEASVARRRAELFVQLSPRASSITALREEVAMQVATLEADVIELRGQLEARRAHLRHVELRLAAEGVRT